MKQTWKNIKNLINGTKEKNIPLSFVIEGKVITEPKQIADAFNNYFNNMGLPPQDDNVTTEEDATVNHFLDYLCPVEHRFQFHFVTESDIKKVLNSLAPKTSYGIDGLSVKFIKIIEDPLVPPLTKIVNQMLASGIFPDFLKTAKITPVYKTGDRKDIKNYRPISVLPSLSKIFEKIILEQMHDYFSSNNLYYNGQYGFRKGHSAENAVMENVDRIVDSFENNNMPIDIFLDLTKAFDSINHSVLLQKLEYYGIRDVAYRLCKSYLENRHQFVLYESAQSDLLKVKLGVPQGSVMGPFLFLVYVNDFCKSSDMFKFNMYADDTTLMINISKRDLVACQSSQSIESVINQELENVLKWLNINKLTVNINKTKFMVFRPHTNSVPKLDLKLENKSISQVQHFNLLGITIDQHLSWKYHIEKVSNKIRKITAIMTCLKHYLPTQTLLLIYNALIMPHLLYGVSVWGQKSSHVSKLQKKLIRIIAKSKYNAHTSPIFKQLCVLKFVDIVKIQDWKFYYKLKHHLAPHYFHHIQFYKFEDIHSHNTRFKEKYIEPKLKYDISKCTIKHRIAKMLNEAPVGAIEKVQTLSLRGLGFFLKRTFVDAYLTHCTVSNCYVCGLMG